MADNADETVGDGQSEASGSSAQIDDTPAKIGPSQQTGAASNQAVSTALIKAQTDQEEVKGVNERATVRQAQQGATDKTSVYLAYLVTVGFLLAVLLVAITQGNGRAASNPVLQTLLGILGTGWASIISFYFGSSVGSRQKDAILGETNTPSKTITTGE